MNDNNAKQTFRLSLLNDLKTDWDQFLRVSHLPLPLCMRSLGFRKLG